MVDRTELEVDLTPWARQAVDLILAAGTAKAGCHTLDKDAMAFALQNIVSARTIAAVEKTFAMRGMN